MTRSEIAKGIWMKPGYREKRSGFRHTPESIEKMRVVHTGMKHVTDEGKARLSKARKGVKRSPEIAEMLKTINIGRKYSDESRKQMSDRQKGKNLGSANPMWKGGCTPLAVSIRMSSKYSEWRFDVFSRDVFTCNSCGVKHDTIEAHHCIKDFMDILRGNNIKTIEEAMMCEEFWDINNGITLCKECHKKVTVANRRMKRLINKPKHFMSEAA